FTLAAIISASQEERDEETDTMEHSLAPSRAILPPHRSPGRLTALAAIAAVLLITLLAGTIFTQLLRPATGGKPTATPTPTFPPCGTGWLGPFAPLICTTTMGVPVVFQNRGGETTGAPTGGNAMTLCFGPGPHCQPNADGPAELARGVRFALGERHSFTF